MSTFETEGLQSNVCSETHLRKKASDMITGKKQQNGNLIKTPKSNPERENFSG